METHVTQPIPAAATVNNIGGDAAQVPSSAFQAAVVASDGGRRTWYIQQDRFQTAVLHVGTGTVITTPGTASLLDVTDVGQYILYTAAAVNDDVGWLGNTANVTRRGYNPTYYAVCRIGGSIASARFFIGLSDISPMSGGLWGIASLMGFRFDTAIPDASNWLAVTSDAGGNGTEIVTDTGVAIAINTSYRFKIVVVSATLVQFYINDVLVATHVSRIPASTTNLGVFAAVRSIGSSGRAIAVGRMLLSQREM